MSDQKKSGQKGNTISLYLDKDIIEWLETKAQEEDRSVSYIANRALKMQKGTEQE